MSPNLIVSPFLILSLSNTLVLNLSFKLSQFLISSPLIKQRILPHHGMKKVKNSILYNSSNKISLSGNSWKHEVLYWFFCYQIGESQPSVIRGNWHTSGILQIHQHFQMSHISSFTGSNFLIAFQVSLNKQCSCSSLQAVPCCND